MTIPSPLTTALLLTGGLLPLAVAPLLARAADRSEATKGAMDAFIAVSMAGIVVLHIWPHAYLAAGLWAVVGGLAGLMLPFLLHGSLHRHERRIYPGLVAVAFLGLIFHAGLDGMALFAPLADAPAGLDDDHAHDHGSESGALLALAVVLHRLPMGLAVWWLVVPVLGRRAALGILGMLAGATVLGFGFAERFFVDLGAPGFAVFEAVVAGMLLHVVAGHDHGHHGHGHSTAHCRHDHAPWGSAVGALTGVALLLFLGHAHPVDRRYLEALTFGDALTALGLHLGPFLLAGVLLQIVLAPRNPRNPEAKDRGRRALVSLLPATVVCLGLLGWAWTWVWIAGALWAVGAARLTGGRSRASDPASGDLWTRFEDRAHYVSVWALLAVGVVSLLEPLVRPLDLGPWLAGVGAALAGAILGRRPLFAVIVGFFLVHVGWGPQSTALYLYAVAASWTLQSRGTVGTAKLLPRILAVGLGGGVVLAIAGTVPILAGTDLHALASRDPRWWQLASLGGLALPLVRRLFQKGFRAFLLPVFDTAAEIVAVDFQEDPPHGSADPHVAPVAPTP